MAGFHLRRRDTAPSAGRIYSTVMIKRGLKCRARRRELHTNLEMKDVLSGLVASSKCEFVLTHPGDPTKALEAWLLETQIGALRKRIHGHPDAGLHALRHTFLTEAGEHTDPFTLQ